MVGILGLQGAHQYLKTRMLTHVFEARVLQEKRPARESRADTSLQPLERSFPPPQQCKDACDLIVAVVRVSKGFWARTSLGQAVERHILFPGQRIKDAL
jgi:hypothetical protein